VAEEKIHRPPSVTGLFVPTMHGLRGWAIFIIFAFHAAIATRYVPNGEVPKAFLEASGFLSLDMLFFTTGFVLFLPVVQAGRFGNVGSFAVRRLARMVPPYYVCLLVILIAYPVLTTDQMAADADHSLGAYLAHMGFVQREVLRDEAGLGVNGPLWAISIDFAFYLLLPLIAGAYLRRPLLGLALATAVSLGWRLVVNEPAGHPDLLIQLPLFLVDFGAGMTAAWALLRLKREGSPPVSPGAAAAIAGACAVALLALTYWAGSTVPFHAGVFQGADLASVAFPLVLGVLMVVIGFTPRPAQWPLVNRPILWFSEISYSVFLYHVVVMTFALVTLKVNPNGSPRAAIVMFAVSFPVTIVLALLSYRFIEQPSRRVGRDIARRISRGGPEPSAASARAGALGTAPDRV
jgi:peptidoglycan/LPS O-acetylase OafA/YrhL